MRRFLLAPLVLVPVVALAGCSGSVSVGSTTSTAVSGDKLGAKVEEQLRKTVQGGDTADIDVSCPDDLDLQTGASETCTLSDSTGAEYDVDVRMQDGDGNFTAQVAQQPRG